MESQLKTKHICKRCKEREIEPPSKLHCQVCGEWWSKQLGLEGASGEAAPLKQPPKRQDGICRDCPQPAERGTVYCSSCLAKRRACFADYRAKLRTGGA